MSAIKTVAIVGLGKMGAPMAKHLLAKGFTVTGCDPLDAARRAALSLGVSVLDSPREATRASELVIIVVGFDHEVETVMFGKVDGVPCAVHPQPYCKEFKDMELVAYMQWIRGDA